MRGSSSCRSIGRGVAAGVLASLLLVAAAARAQEAADTGAADPVGLAAAELAGLTAAELVAELGSPSWPRREAAERLLIELGETARAVLGAVTSDPDPEIALRAAHALDGIGRAARARDKDGRQTDPIDRLDPRDLEALAMAIEVAVVPEADVAPLQSWLDEQGEVLRARIGKEQRLDRIVRRVADFHFKVLELHVAPPAGSRDLTLSSLREERQADSLTIAACMILLGRRAGVEVGLAESPGCCLLVCGDPAGEALWVDVETGGEILDREQAESRLVSLPRTIYQATHLNRAGEAQIGMRLLQLIGHMAMREGAPAVRESIGRLQDRLQAASEGGE